MAKRKMDVRPGVGSGSEEHLSHWLFATPLKMFTRAMSVPLALENPNIRT
jgi:hypothetical protein